MVGYCQDRPLTGMVESILKNAQWGLTMEVLASEIKMIAEQYMSVR